MAVIRFQEAVKFGNWYWCSSRSRTSCCNRVYAGQFDMTN